MTIEGFFKKIDLSEGGADAYFTTAAAKTDYFTGLLYNNRNRFFKEIKKEKNYRQRALRLYLDIAFANRSTLGERGIPESVYLDTCRDISIWCQNCFDKFGEYGLDELEWVAKSIDFRVFRLGRLQFELIYAPRKYKATGKIIQKGDILLNVHIPQGQPLGLPECLVSFAEARSFFKGAQNFLCDSWLLFPELKQILPADCNIMKFQNLFEPLFTDCGSKQAEERIFKKVLDEPSLYPENTSLQVAAKRYLLCGGKLGQTTGILSEGTMAEYRSLEAH